MSLGEASSPPDGRIAAPEIAGEDGQGDQDLGIVGVAVNRLAQPRHGRPRASGPDGPAGFLSPSSAYTPMLAAASVSRSMSSSRTAPISSDTFSMPRSSHHASRSSMMVVSAVGLRNPA